MYTSHTHKVVEFNCVLSVYEYDFLAILAGDVVNDHLLYHMAGVIRYEVAESLLLRATGWFLVSSY